MSTQPTLRTPASTLLLGAAAAVLSTAVMLSGVDGLAQHRTVSSYAQVIELPRVVVTAQRLVAKQPVAKAGADAVDG